MAYGYELLLDLYECDEKACDDLNLCYRYLDEVVSHLGMNKQAPPSIFRTDATDRPRQAGLVGWVPLIESSVVIHTMVPDRFITVDIYSCQRFDYEDAAAFTEKFFKPKSIDRQHVVRGQKLWTSNK